MNVALVLLGAVVFAAVLGVVVWAAGRRGEAQAGELRREIQASVTSQAQLFNNQIGQMTQAVNQQLGLVRQELQSSVANSGKLALDAQRDVAKRLDASYEALRDISKQVGEMREANRQLSQTTDDLQKILGGAKSRGILGEAMLDRLLEDVLPRSAYETQYRFNNGSSVDAIIRDGDYIICIDSKFPLESYRRLADGADGARREFASAVRKHADSIAEKYILPAERTLDFALMFIPSEGVYYEVLVTEDGKNGMLADYCRSMKVLPISPNTCYAYLRLIATSLRGLRVEESARQLMASLGGLQGHLQVFASVFDKVGTHLHNASNCYDDADVKLGKFAAVLEQTAQGTLSEPPAQAKIKFNGASALGAERPVNSRS
jgi:DNA recombination protein RmuC